MTARRARAGRRTAERPRAAPEGDAPPLIEARGLALRRGGDTLLEDVRIAVRPGEVVTVIGPNGGGKTSLLRILLGLVPPGEGRVNRIHGLRIGYMPQRVAIDETLPLTVRRFIQLGRAVPPGRIVETAREVEVDSLLDRPVQRISGGEMQRVLLARALLGDPRLLVLDEPTSGLDVFRQLDFYGRLPGLRERRRCAILLVSHDLRFAMALSDRIVCLNRSVRCSGAPGEVSRAPAFRMLFREAAVPAGGPADG